jgi:hypothetical protein
LLLLLYSKTILVVNKLNFYSFLEKSHKMSDTSSKQGETHNPFKEKDRASTKKNKCGRNINRFSKDYLKVPDAMTFTAPFDFITFSVVSVQITTFIGSLKCTRGCSWYCHKEQFPV